MARYRPSPELLNIFKEDLPDDIENIVDQVASNTEAIVDDLIDAYEADMKEKVEGFSKDVKAQTDAFDQEVDQIKQQLEAGFASMNQALQTLQAETAKFKAATDATPELALDVTEMTNDIEALNTAIETQRQQLRQLGESIGNYTGLMVKLALPL